MTPASCSYRPDIYGLDSRVASKLEGHSVNLVTSAIDKPEPAEKTAATQTGEQPGAGQGAAQAEGRQLPDVQSVLRDLRQLAQDREARWRLASGRKLSIGLQVPIVAPLPPALGEADLATVMPRCRRYVGAD